MLRHDVIEAVAQNRFQIYSVETIDQCMTLLSGLDAGERNEQGKFPDGSVNQRVRARLQDFAEKRHSFGTGNSQSNTS
jgi:predicted ATP-dependent protease